MPRGRLQKFIQIDGLVVVGVHRGESFFHSFGHFVFGELAIPIFIKRGKPLRRIAPAATSTITTAFTAAPSTGGTSSQRTGLPGPPSPGEP